jgi:ribonuclease HI
LELHQGFLPSKALSISAAKQWIFDFIPHEGPLSSTVIAVTCWHIWEAHNDARNNQSDLLPARVALKIKAYVDMLIQFCFKTKPAKQRETTSSAPRWSPPPAGLVCINVDAALFPNEHRIGWDAVLRDHTGAFISSCSEGLSDFHDPEIAEGLAIRKALPVLSNHGFQNMIIASDCKSMVHRISSTSWDRSSAGTVMNDINTSEKLYFLSFQACQQEIECCSVLVSSFLGTLWCYPEFHSA